MAMLVSMSMSMRTLEIGMLVIVCEAFAVNVPMLVRNVPLRIQAFLQSQLAR